MRKKTIPSSTVPGVGGGRAWGGGGGVEGVGGGLHTLRKHLNQQH